METTIYVHLPDGKQLTFNVDSYENDKGVIKFLDKKTGKPRGFPLTWCEFTYNKGAI